MPVNSAAARDKDAGTVCNFLKKKLSGYSIIELLRIELEAWLFFLVGSIPGSAGFLLRNAVCALLFKSKGGTVLVQPRVTFVHCHKISAGKMLGVNSGCYINAVGGVAFGDFVLLGSNVTISSGIHPIDGCLPPVYARPVVPKPIIVEDDVWIGAGAVILPGVILRKGTVVGANAVVTKTTSEYAVVVGAPAREIRNRNASNG